MGTTLVLGASLKSDRYSNMAIHDLLGANEKVIGVGLQEGQVDGVQIFKEMTPFEHIDTVTLYVGPKNQSIYFDYVVSLHPKRVIFNPGTRNKKFEEILIENNIPFEHACTLVLLKTRQY